MPITLPPTSRRGFLTASAAAAVSAIASPSWAGETAEENIDADRFAMLADTHVPGDPKATSRGVNMYDNLASVCKQLTALDKKPAAVMITGDCAYLSGKKEDYASILKLVDPVRKAGMPVHLLLGNHDHRENVMAAIPHNADESPLADKPVENKHVAILRSPRANWFLLDSLQKVNHTPGQVGEKQIAWLAKALDQNKDKPALIGVHHNPYPHKMALQDHKELFKVLAPRKQVKAVFFGHTHTWRLDKRDGIHMINLPPVAYTFKRGMVNGWVDAQLADDQITLRLVCHDTKHRLHNKTTELAWRV
jgi:Icc protein